MEEYLTAVIIALSGIYVGTFLTPPLVVDTTPIIHVEKEVRMEVPVNKIVRISLEQKFDVVTALRIADCESKLGTDVINKHSSARGIYQFLSGTWQHYCTGDVMNEEDNIRCFIKLYPDHPEWWVCQ